MDERIDPITLEVIKNMLSMVADEMALVVIRTAYSHVMRDSMDYSTALCDWEGRTISQGLTNPIHLGSFPDAMRVVKAHKDTMQPGDVFIFNDPYTAGGMHLPDVFIVKPVFVDGRIEGFAATLGHQCDVGGIAPGGMAVYAMEIFQEGLRIPFLKLYEAGKPNETMFELLAQNVRLPVQVLGDIRAQLAACRAGERGLLQLIGKYGVGTYRRYIDELHDYAERLMREEITALRDGVYEFEDWLDGLGETPEPIRFKVTITVAGDEIAIDWTGSSPQVKGSVNGPMPTTNSMAYLAVRCTVRAPVPNCEGYMRAIKVTAPPGTVVNPTPPAACGARGIIAYRMLDAMFGALAQVAPDRVPAASEGGPSSAQFAGRTDDGKTFVIGGGLLGCWGGRRDRDGLDGVSNPGANLSNQPIEIIEAGVPIEIVSYSLVENSGGPGRSRGGYALMREFRMLADESVLIMRSDRRAVLPYGLAGGLPGTPSWNVVNPGPDQRLLPVCPMSATPLKRGDIFRHVMPGGGGYGDPLERDPEKVAEEVRNEMITAAYAFDVYGVAMIAQALDPVGTAKRRSELRQHRDDTAYLRHFHDHIGVDWRKRPQVAQAGRISASAAPARVEPAP